VFYQQHQAEGFEVVAAINEVTGSEGAAAWADLFSLTHTVLADSDWAVWDQYNPTGNRPFYLVFDRDLIIRASGVGPGGHADAEETVLGLLAP
jgi:hypothetical protein